MHLLKCFGDIRVLMEVGIQTSNISSCCLNCSVFWI